MTEMTEAGWFAITPLGDDVYVIAEPPHVNSFLIAGSKRAVLFDTGMGIASIRAAAEQITDHELLVVNSHSHWDHRGGNGEFTQIAIHDSGAEAFGQPVPVDELTAYADSVAEMLEKFAVYREIDEAFFRLLEPGYLPRQLPAGFAAERWVIPATVPSQLLADGDRLDLGGRVLEVLHTPGHTGDSICLLDARFGRLFAGDTLASGPHAASLPGSDPDIFEQSLRRLASEVAPRVSVVHPCHMLRPVAPASLIGEVTEAFQRIRFDPPRWTSSINDYGTAVREYWFDRFSVIVPEAWAAQGPPSAQP
jgi:glyoxylase-like metal-dependent hydrolase (beta-lactamase superfamily II)